MNKRLIYPQWMLLAPLLLYFLLFLLPGLLGVFFAFTDWNVRSAGEINFVGLQNFREIFTGTTVRYSQGIINTLRFTLVSNIVKIIPSLFLAILLSSGLKGRNIYRTILYMPSILPFLIIGLVFNAILSFNGLLNNLFESLGLAHWQLKWLSDPNIVWYSIYGVDAWRGIGYVMTIFLASINAIPRSYYEAAEIDGANFFQRLRHITLPMISGAITINLVFGITYGLKVFDIVYVLTNGGPGRASEVITTYSYQLYAQGRYGMATAMNTILLMLTLLLGLLIVRWMTKKEVQH
ncbi:MAG: carbohydrate ABC transporter permease [Christensenellales bacterium]|jgi:raffinose/stachyose/melibiose transport system permease protein